MTLSLPDEDAYRAHYVATFTRRPLRFATAAGDVPVYFEPHHFEHAFYESTRRDGSKDAFSLVRAQRMDDIPVALADPSLQRRAGWDKTRKCYDHVRCVTVTTGDFVVVIRLGVTRTGRLKGRFVTCYVADNSIGKILRAPNWDEHACRTNLMRA